MKRRVSSGYHIIQLMGLILLSLMVSAITIDSGFYFAAHNKLRTASDAAALAAASELYRSNALDPTERQDDARMAADDYISENEPSLTLDADDAAFGYVDPVTKTYQPANYGTPSNNPNYAMTGGINAARVVLRRTEGSSNGPLSTVVSRMLGINSMNAGTFSVAFIDQGIGSVTNGLRPIYACQAQVTQAMLDNIPQNNVIRIYGDRMEVDGIANIAGCPPPGSGNWGFADLRNCNPDVPGASDTASWFSTGFPGTVHSNRCYSTQSGNFLTNTEVRRALDTLIANETVISIPIYNQYSGGGADTQVTISGFVGFVITGYAANGSSNNRHITGYFTKTICTDECTTSSDGSGNSGLMAKLRLAYQS
jgi:Flp pilus assembly protein TadG